MNPTQKSRKKNKIANHINDLKSQVLSLAGAGSPRPGTVEDSSPPRQSRTRRPVPPENPIRDDAQVGVW